MKIKAAIAGILALFAVASASAQQFPTVPDHTVIGRIGVGGQSGPSQAIPFASLLPQINGPQLANKIYAGPASGVAALPTFRSLVVADLPGLRLPLTASTTFYVSPSGSDVVTCGLVIGTPCQTLQYITNLIHSGYDLRGFTATVQMADGTYTAGAIVDGPWVGGGNAGTNQVVYQGNSGTPNNVIISTVSGPCFQAQNSAVIAVQNMLLRCVYDLFSIYRGSIYVLGGVTFDGVNVASSLIMYATRFGYIEVTGSNSVLGTGIPDALFNSTHSGNLRVVNATFTFGASPTYAIATVYSEDHADVTFTGTVTFTLGAFTVTGTRYIVDANAVLQWIAASQTSIPGTVAGTVSLGGVYYIAISHTNNTPQITVLTSGSGTYNVPINTYYLEIEMVGGGGGGAGSGTTPGAAGVGGNTCWNTSGAACTTPVYQAGGGALGSVTPGTTSAGGTVSGSGTCNDSQPGGAGTSGTSQLNTYGGAGGNSRYGGGGAAGFGGTGTAGVTNSGSGGGGSGDTTANSGGGGGAGAWCMAQINFPTLAASYTYAIAAAGTAGTAGGSGTAGSAGAAGKIKVTAYFQ